MNTFYVYTHSDINGNVFYVGKGTKRRAWNTTTRTNEWVAKIKDGYIIDVPYTELTEDEAFDLEALLIETYGFENLVNKKKESPKESRGTTYYKILQIAKDYKALNEILDNFEYYNKIPYFRKHFELIHFVTQLRDEYGLL